MEYYSAVKREQTTDDKPNSITHAKWKKPYYVIPSMLYSPKEIYRYRKQWLLGAGEVISYKQMRKYFWVMEMFCLDCSGDTMTECVQFYKTVQWKEYI